MNNDIPTFVFLRDSKGQPGFPSVRVEIPEGHIDDTIAAIRAFLHAVGYAEKTVNEALGER